MLVLTGSGGLGLVAWLGLYDVAASAGHWPITDRFLRFGMENSVKAHAPDIVPPPLDDAAMIRLGAGHFQGGCAYCHGAPGRAISPVSAAMLPPPPDLARQVGLWSDRELFQIVMHGIKYAGMPAWPALQRSDEVWAVVAFLRRLPSLDEAAYRRLALGEVETESEAQGGREIATRRGAAEAVSACARCHGAQAAPDSALVPMLHGQPSAMLTGALRAYAQGERQSGVMQMIASGLSEREMRQIADYYADLPIPASAAAATVPPDAFARGERLATEGDRERDVPACASCHVASALPAYPRLAGQSARYLEGQLAAWRNGANDVTPTGRIMAPIARRLTPEQAADVSAYFAGLAAVKPVADGPKP